jgi:hypothetical protein
MLKIKLSKSLNSHVVTPLNFSHCEYHGDLHLSSVADAETLICESWDGVPVYYPNIDDNCIIFFDASF